VSTRARSLTLLFAAVPILAAACTGVTVDSPTTSSSTTSPSPDSTVAAATASGLPSFSHVYLIILENEEYGSVVGSPDAPYLNGLIASYGLASNYFGVAHPSQPNYLALFSGSTQGVTNDSNHDVSAINLADQLEAKGRTWAVFAQDYPGDCFTGATKGGSGEGIGAKGSYARKHNPAISFTDISSNPSRCAHITNLAAFDPAAADFEMIVPNQCNDMHSCPVSTGDEFLKEFVPKITSSAAFAGSVLFITFDEGSSDAGGGGHIVTIVVSPLVKPGFQSATKYDHYSLLRTIEDSWGLGCLGQACSATDMAGFFS
jgi:hypothetical protein